MGLFRKKHLDYSYGLGLLPKLRTTYIKHSLPGEISHFQRAQLIDFKLMQEEALNGKSEELFIKACEFIQHLEDEEADYNYKQKPIYKKIADIVPPDITENPIGYIAHIAKTTIDNKKEIHLEFLPFLEEFENKLEIKFTGEQKRTIMRLFKFGMYLSLIENQSGLGIQGTYHPSIFNCLSSSRVVIQNLGKHKINIDLDFVNTSERQMEVVSLALSVGYFHSKYSLESPKTVMEFVK